LRDALKAERARRSTASPTGKDRNEVAEELAKLRELRDQGVLTDEDYGKKRERLRRY
jgi:hypothetical protein